MSDDRFSIDDNIVLDPKTAKTNNIKKILTGIAILVVLFLIVLIIMKFINSGNVEEPKPLVMPSEEIIFKPKTKKLSQPIKEVEEKKVENTNLEPQIVEIRPIKIEEIPKKTEAPKPEIKVEPQVEFKDEPKQEPKQEVVVVTSKKDEPKKAEVKKVEVKKDEPKKVEVKKTEAKKVEAKKAEVKKETPKQDIKKADTKKAEIKEVKKAETKKAEAKKETPKTSTKQTPASQTKLQSGNYIQVLATAEFKPDADYIKKLKNKGYSYTLYKTTVKGKEYIKVLVGPFDEAKLQSEMATIRATVNKDAFVFRVK